MAAGTFVAILVLAVVALLFAALVDEGVRKRRAAARRDAAAPTDDPYPQEAPGPRSAPRIGTQRDG